MASTRDSITDIWGPRWLLTRIRQAAPQTLTVPS